MKRFEQLTRAITIGGIAMGVMMSVTLSSTPAASENKDIALRPEFQCEMITLAAASPV
jgi:hypothetical protein